MRRQRAEDGTSPKEEHRVPDALIFEHTDPAPQLRDLLLVHLVLLGIHRDTPLEQLDLAILDGAVGCRAPAVPRVRVTRASAPGAAASGSGAAAVMAVVRLAAGVAAVSVKAAGVRIHSAERDKKDKSVHCG